MSTPEQLLASPENNLEAIGEAARSRSEQLRGQEFSGELSPESAEKQAEHARAEAMEAAVSVEKGGAERSKQAEPTAPAARQRPASKSNREASFKRTMNDVQHELNPSSRTFSKIIHNRAIETTSEVIGSTIARPSAIAAGSFAALVLTFALYMLAKYYGYPLSGFETIGAFVAGWILGLIYDFLKMLITGRR